MTKRSYHTLIKEMPESDRPRERLEFHGPGVLSNAELLAIVLRTGTRQENAVSLAQRLISTFDKLEGVARATHKELCQVPGIGPAKAAQVQAALELGKRVAVAGAEDRVQITCPADAARIFESRFHGLAHEELHVLLLDTRNHVQRVVTVYVGNVNTALIRVSEVFRRAIRDNAPALILAHNHPTGDTSPSADDIQVTQEIVKAGQLLDIQVLDHLIIGKNTFLSMKERRLGF